MRLLLNILWVIFGGGFIIWLEYVIGGLLLCLTIIGIPFGVQCFKIAGLGLLPFGKDILDAPGGSAVGFVLNVFWLIVAGVWIFLSHIALALGLAVTIIGIPFAIQHVKLAMLALAPFGKLVRETR
ncbi:YccF domain-containing protein [Vitiosangium sp. GDMCC 1.1324]|uniref:YccF domain-containing protein n=1 Tax=Vitiosangium sp. (strain GDMCC 1.1324) TaxID=2138576 RepID=UPI000D3C6201|nr:YccF domain-containing protein [Vitiosangium sp. GDMCC 1.1324]PTL75858.1 YccF domain-containing protein [Vitiosangium sp. GDMCC 1.1324]